MCINLGGLFFGGGLGQLGEEQSTVTGEGATAEVEWHRCRSGALFRDVEHFAVQAEFAKRAVGVQDHILVGGTDVQFGQNMIVEEFNAIEESQLF